MIDVKEREQTASAPAATTPVRVRKLGHIVFRVSDIERTTKFWTDIMGFKISDYNEHGMVFFHAVGDHHTVALAPAKDPSELPGKSQVGFDHAAFEVGSMDELFRIRDFLRAKGVKLTFEGRKGPGCNPGVEFQDPDGYTIELYAGMDQMGWDGKSRPPEQWRRCSSLEDVIANPLP
ncbi:MAG TPA: VOC family protein [Chloroflexota bacterium]|nr:VOC family protein [Chloroflexota bacterium]